MKSVIYLFDPVLYPFPLLVTKKFDPKELGDMFYVINTNNDLEHRPEEFVPNTNTTARTIEVVSKKTELRYVLIMLCRVSVIGDGTIAHESYHASNMIADVCGFLPDKVMYDEPVAYLIQWMANCVRCVLVNKPKRMKGELFTQK